MKTIWFWQKKDFDNINSSEEEKKTSRDKIMYYHWNCRYPKIKW